MTDDMPKIDKGVPIPHIHSKIVRPRFSDMTDGDSYFLPGATPNTILAIRNEAQRVNIGCSARTVTENGVKGVRIWRITKAESAK